MMLKSFRGCRNPRARIQKERERNGRESRAPPSAGRRNSARSCAKRTQQERKNATDKLAGTVVSSNRGDYSSPPETRQFLSFATKGQGPGYWRHARNCGVGSLSGRAGHVEQVQVGVPLQNEQTQRCRFAVPENAKLIHGQSGLAASRKSRTRRANND